MGTWSCPAPQCPNWGCMVWQVARDSPMPNRASTFLSASCRGVSLPTPGVGIQLPLQAGTHLPQLTDAVLGHLKLPEQYLLRCTADVPYVYFFGNKITACCTSFRLFTFALFYAHKTVCDTPYQLNDQRLAHEWSMNCFWMLAGNCCKNVSR